MLISVIIPCYNEARTLQQVVDTVLTSPADVSEIIIVDDGCTDQSTGWFVAHPQDKVRVVVHPRNCGKGAAIRTGLAQARGDIVIIQDADLEYLPGEYPRLLGPILDGRADVVYGSRFAGGEAHRVVYFWHYVANCLLTLLSNALTNLNLTDMETGCKAFRASALQGLTLKEDRFGFEPEITARLARRGARFYEVGITYHGRTYEEGKKVGVKDAFRAIWAIVKYNLLVRA